MLVNTRKANSMTHVARALAVLRCDRKTPKRMKGRKIQRVLSATSLVAGIHFGGLASTQAAVAVSWSGGNGAPLSVTFAEPVEFLVVDTPTGRNPTFVMAGVGDLFGEDLTLTTGLTFSVNGGSDFDITGWRSGSIWTPLVSDYMWFWGSLPGVTLGDVVTLNAGTLTGGARYELSGRVSYEGAPPANGSIEMFIMDENGRRLGDAVSIPEVSSASLVGLGMLGMLRRRR